MRVAVRWATGEEADLRGRVIQIFSPGDVTVIPVDDDTWLCDFCNADLMRDEERPFAIVGDRALCRRCARQVYGVTPGVTTVEVPEE